MKTIIYFATLLFLFTVFSCSKDSGEKGINKDTSLPEALMNKVSGLKVINSSINTKSHTTSLLYGNQKAVDRIKTNSLNMQRGEKFVWITWSQQPDPNWFGAYIPGKLLSFEIIESKETIEYQKITGNGTQVKEDSIDNRRRIQVLLQQKMNVTP